MTASFLFASLPESAPREVWDIFDLWRALRVARDGGANALPARADFTADVLAPWFDHMAVAAYQEAENDVMVLRSGDAITRLLGVDLNMRRFSQALPMISRAAAVAPYRAAMRVRRPTFSSIVIPGLPSVARLIMPIATEQGGVEFLVAVYSMDDGARRRGVRYAPASATRFVILDIDGRREPAPAEPKRPARPRRHAPTPERRTEPDFAEAERPIPLKEALDDPAAPPHVNPLERTLDELGRVLGDVKKPGGWRFARSKRRRAK